MRNALNCSMLPIPIVEDTMNNIEFKPMRFISSNGYYGYQPTRHQKEDSSKCETRKDEAENMETQCNNDGHDENMEISIPRYTNRKRPYEYHYCNDLPDFKKRRQSEPLPIISGQPEPAPLNRAISYRNPTHNMPDMPRCMMGHYV